MNGVGKVSVSNLGDSRAVIGLYEPTGLRTVVMSHDHTANDSAEIRRLKHDFPADGNIRINKGGNGNVIIGGSNAHDQAHTDQEESDWRVKGICQFTRSLGQIYYRSTIDFINAFSVDLTFPDLLLVSLGDFQMKERAIATVYNDYTRGSKVIPAPKTQKRKDGSRCDFRLIFGSVATVFVTVLDAQGTTLYHTNTRVPRAAHRKRLSAACVRRFVG